MNFDVRCLLLPLLLLASRVILDKMGGARTHLGDVAACVSIEQYLVTGDKYLSGAELVTSRREDSSNRGLY